MGVATALTVAGMVSTAAGAVSSWSQAAKQNRLQDQAQRDAEKAMADARRKLEINYYDQLGINKEPYELQREAALVQGAEAIQAGAESERGAAATAGRVQLAQNEAQAGIRTAMGKEMSEIERLKAEEDSRLRDVGAQIDLQEAQGQQQMAADAAAASAAATAQGFQGLTSLGQQAIQQAPLFTGKSNLGIDETKAAERMKVMGQPNVNRPSSIGQLVPGALNPLQTSKIMNATTPKSNFVMQNQTAYQTQNPFDIFPPQTNYYTR